MTNCDPASPLKSAAFPRLRPIPIGWACLILTTTAASSASAQTADEASAPQVGRYGIEVSLPTGPELELRGRYRLGDGQSLRLALGLELYAERDDSPVQLGGRYLSFGGDYLQSLGKGRAQPYMFGGVRVKATGGDRYEYGFEEDWKEQGAVGIQLRAGGGVSFAITPELSLGSEVRAQADLYPLAVYTVGGDLFLTLWF